LGSDLEKRFLGSKINFKKKEKEIKKKEKNNLL